MLDKCKNNLHLPTKEKTRIKKKVIASLGNLAIGDNFYEVFYNIKKYYIQKS